MTRTQYVRRVHLYSALTRVTTWHPFCNAYPMRVVRFWTAKLLGLHEYWRSEGAAIPRFLPEEQ
jgi:hypothetical protein